jgi:hypothetical protein
VPSRSLTSRLALLQRAAASLPVGERDHFLQSVAAHLTGAPTDDAVIAAINAALDAAALAWRAWRGGQHKHVPTPLPPLASRPRRPWSFLRPNRAARSSTAARLPIQFAWSGRWGSSAPVAADGRNVTIEFRSAEGQYDRLPTIADDFVRRQVNLIAVGTLRRDVSGKSETRHWAFSPSIQAGAWYYLNAMNYKKIEYFIRARPGRDEWTLAISYPKNAKATEIKFSGTRDERARMKYSIFL